MSEAEARRKEKPQELATKKIQAVLEETALIGEVLSEQGWDRGLQKEGRVLDKYNAILLPQLFQTELLFRSHDQMGHQGIDKVYQRILKRFEWPGMKKACERRLKAFLSRQQVKDPRKLRFPLQSTGSSEFNEVVHNDHQKKLCMTAMATIKPW